MRILKIISVLTFCLASLSACSVMKNEKTAADLKLIKNLEGQWISEHIDPMTKKKQRVNYRVISGGTTVEEVIFPGTAHEMVSMYTQSGDSIMMTHYCALGNQPILEAKELDGNSITFKYIGGSNIKNGDMYINGLKITFNGPNKMTQEWTATKECEGPKQLVFIRIK
jgi:hypothetical protein